MESDNYGVHLTLRIGHVEQRQDRLSLNDPLHVENFLKDLVDRIGMRVLAGPLMCEEHGEPEKEGVSGVIILYESHAAIHTYPFLGEAFIDVFSCKPFETRPVLVVLRNYFGNYVVIEQQITDRGIHWNTQAAKALQEWQNQR